MTLTSVAFAFFLVAVFTFYWRLGQASILRRNAVLLAANLVFYASWNITLVPVLVGVLTIDFVWARALAGARSQASRSVGLVGAVLWAVAPLLFYKYAHFLAASTFGVTTAGWDDAVAAAVAPVGLSFLTFARLAYFFDVHRGITTVATDYIAFLAYLTFFPTVLSGPIERSTTLLPQLLREARTTENSLGDGIRQFLWGAAKKLLVADGVAPWVAMIFDHYHQASGVEIAVGTLLFSVQVYCDFSGYSEMAQGVARCLGLEVTRNFHYPYFSRSISEFWRRWHVSLSTWFRDYVFFPLGANYKGRARWVLNIFVTFALCGLWHGANWTYVAWGLVIGAYFLPEVIWPPRRPRSRVVARGRRLPTVTEAIQMGRTFLLVTLSWIPFRSATLADAGGFASRMVTGDWTAMPLLGGSAQRLSFPWGLASALGLAGGVLCIEWIQREKPHALSLHETPVWAQWAVCYGLVLLLLVGSSAQPVKYLYASY